MKGTALARFLYQRRDRYHHTVSLFSLASTCKKRHVLGKKQEQSEAQINNFKQKVNKLYNLVYLSVINQSWSQKLISLLSRKFIKNFNLHSYVNLTHFRFQLFEFPTANISSLPLSSPAFANCKQTHPLCPLTYKTRNALAHNAGIHASLITRVPAQCSRSVRLFSLPTQTQTPTPLCSTVTTTSTRRRQRCFNSHTAHAGRRNRLSLACSQSKSDSWAKRFGYRCAG